MYIHIILFCFIIQASVQDSGSQLPESRLAHKLCWFQHIPISCLCLYRSKVPYILSSTFSLFLNMRCHSNANKFPNKRTAYMLYHCMLRLINLSEAYLFSVRWVCKAGKDQGPKCHSMRMNRHIIWYYNFKCTV